MRAPGRCAGQQLTGIGELRDIHKGKPAIVCGSGTTLNHFDFTEVPDGWVLCAVNESIRKIGSYATYWVHSDRVITLEYAKYCPQSVTILAMHEATQYIKAARPDNKIYTTMSHAVTKSYDDGMNFFSRGTVLIGAIEMLRYMGIRKFYCFGLDCFRTRNNYYYDGRRPQKTTEIKTIPFEYIKSGVPRGVHIWVTPRLKLMIEKLSTVRASGMWNDIEIWCVNSPHSQQTAIPKLSMDDFREHVRRIKESENHEEKAATPKRRGRPRKIVSKDQEAIGDPKRDDDGDGPPGATGNDGDGDRSAEDAGSDAGRGYEKTATARIRRDRDASGDDDKSDDSGTADPWKALSDPDD